MINKQFLYNEYRKALKKGYYHIAWVILQNLHRRARNERNEGNGSERISRIYVNESGTLSGI